MNPPIFKADTTERLINLVKQHPELYNLHSINYEDQVIKNNIWKNIASELGLQENDCKTKWENVLAYYKKFRNRAIRERGNGSERPGLFETMRKFKQSLEFLENTAFVEIETLASDNDYTLDNQESESESSSSEESVAAEASENNIPEAIQGAKRKVSVKQKKQSQSKRKRLCIKNHLAEEMETKQEETKNLIKELRETLTQNSSLDPAISMFFQSIATSVNRFTPQLQARAKSEIMNIVAQLEIQNINEQRILDSATNFSTQWNSTTRSRGVLSETLNHSNLLLHRCVIIGIFNHPLESEPDNSVNLESLI